MAGERAAAGTEEDQKVQEWAQRQLQDPKVRHRIEKLQAQAKNGKPEDAGITAEDLLNLAREQRGMGT